MTQHEGEGRERTPEEIQAEINRTRSTVQQDIKAIGEKFSSEQVKQSAKGVLADAKQEGATMIRETKEAAADSLRSARDQAVQGVSERAHEVAEQARRATNVAGEYAHRASERAGEVASRAGEYAQRAGERAGEYAHRAGDYARHAGAATTGFVGANAIPLSLIGLGAGWLALSMRKQRSLRYEDELGVDEYYDEVDEFSTLNGGAIRERSELGRHEGRDYTGVARERASNLADGARERAANLAEGARNLAGSARDRVGALAERATQGVEAVRSRASETASQLGHQASELSHEARVRLSQAQARTRDFAEENPLAVGALAIAAGVGIGLLLPTSRPENRLMGATRDRLIGDARELLDEAREAGGRIGQKAKETADELRGSVSDRLSH